MHFPRSSGILFHPTSLPGRYGIGDLGATAYQFVNFLADAGQRLWQILPLSPTGFGNSPYQSPSAFAGNPLLINPDDLVEERLLPPGNLPPTPAAFQVEDQVDYDAVIPFKLSLLRRSFEHFRTHRPAEHQAAYADFCASHEAWLEDYAFFMAIREHHQDQSWSTWEQDIALRRAEAVRRWKTTLAEQIELHKYQQYLFFSQWSRLKAYANERGIQIVGDMPIYVAYDSADVWANPHLFKLDSQGNPTVVAGVPPDYFSATGQRWGNPIYRWDTMARNSFEWWIRRMKHTLAMVDIVRIDHFRGFESYWEVPAHEETAVNGTWVKGPGAAFFHKLNSVFGDLPIIAEDLGLITPQVEALRDEFRLPGMKVLQFAFGDDASNPYLPHNYRNPNCVVYTGTHDNDTTTGWFDSLGTAEQERVQCYLGRDGSDVAWDFMRLAFESVAELAITPLQDMLRLGSEARMNTPGTVEHNWGWRLRPKMLTPGLAGGVRTLTAAYGRCE
jgi:4-alpha-glucanotransferase